LGAGVPKPVFNEPEFDGVAAIFTKKLFFQTQKMFVWEDVIRRMKRRQLRQWFHLNETSL